MVSADITNAIIMAVSISSAAGVLFFLSLVCVPLLFVVLDISDYSKCMVVNLKLMSEGMVTVVDANGVFDLPGAGLHLIWMRGPVFFYKTITMNAQQFQEEKYRVFVPRFLRGASSVILAWFRNPNTAAMIQLESLRAGEWSSRLDPMLVSSKATPCQAGAVEGICSDYKKKNHASMIISGVPGSGKSHLAYYVAQRLSGIVLKGFNPTLKGLGIIRLINSYTPTIACPLIVLMNEFDSAIAYAEKSEETKTDTTCLAQTKTSLLNMLDYLNEVDGLIIIATTNVDFKDLPVPYIRKGRFDRMCTFDKPITRS